MELFLDSLPLSHLAITLPLITSEPGRPTPPPNSLSSDWFVDTGFVGEAFAWRPHLEAAGLDTDFNRYHRLATLRSSAFGGVERFPIRRADLWLTSSIPANHNRYYCLPADEGIVFRDQDIPASQARSARPLIGMRLLKRSRLRFEVDFLSGTYSVWIP